jgi:hypothetical protein
VTSFFYFLCPHSCVFLFPHPYISVPSYLYFNVPPHLYFSVPLCFCFLCHLPFIILCPHPFTFYVPFLCAFRTDRLQSKPIMENCVYSYTSVNSIHEFKRIRYCISKTNM